MCTDVRQDNVILSRKLQNVPYYDTSSQESNDNQGATQLNGPFPTPPTLKNSNVNDEVIM